MASAAGHHVCALPRLLRRHPLPDGGGVEAAGVTASHNVRCGEGRHAPARVGLGPDAAVAGRPCAGGEGRPGR